jgi:hypothetical protein
MSKFEARQAGGFRWPRNATLYSQVRLHFKDHRPPRTGVLTGTVEFVQLDREHTFSHSEIASVVVIKSHQEIL